MISTKWWKLLAVVALSGVLVACGDDDSTGAPDAGGGEDAGRDASAPAEDAGGDEDAGRDGGVADAGSDDASTDDASTGDASTGDASTDDASTDGGVTAPAEPVVLQLSEGHDRLFGVAHDAAGNIYVTGQIAQAGSTDFAVLVAKLDASGELVDAFGDDGVVVHNVAAGGGSRETGRGIVIQPSTGDVVIAADVEHDPGAAGLLAQDTDIVLLRFDGTTGAFDEQFGDSGVARLNPNNGVITQNASGTDVMTAGDTHWSLSLAPDEHFVVHGTTRAADAPGGPARTDNDWVLARFTDEGELDTSFSQDGWVTLDVGGTDASVSARSASVLPDGSIVAAGYMTSTVLGERAQQPVIYKVLANGTFDPNFAAGGAPDAVDAPGVWHGYAGVGMRNAEAYGAALQGDHFVTIGYGPTPALPRGTSGATPDWVSFRFSLDGVLDTSYGTDGSTYVDIGGGRDNGRAMVVLPDNRVVGVGGGTPMPAAGATAEVDGTVVILAEDGAPDTTFAAGGFRTYDLGNTDFFWGVSAAPGGASVAIVGIAGAQMSTDDDDSVLFILPVE